MAGVVVCAETMLGFGEVMDVAGRFVLSELSVPGS